MEKQRSDETSKLHALGNNVCNVISFSQHEIKFLKQEHVGMTHFLNQKFVDLQQQMIQLQAQNMRLYQRNQYIMRTQQSLMNKVLEMTNTMGNIMICSNTNPLIEHTNEVEELGTMTNLELRTDETNNNTTESSDVMFTDCNPEVIQQKTTGIATKCFPFHERQQ